LRRLAGWLAGANTWSHFVKISTSTIVLLAGLTCGILAFGLTPYNVMHLAGIHIYWILAGTVLVSAVWTSFRMRMPAGHIILYLCAGVVTGLAGRIVFDLLRDPTTHNLFPFELVAATLITVMAAVTGVFLAGVVRRFRNAQP
jgi:hypothetical protein